MPKTPWNQRAWKLPESPAGRGQVKQRAVQEVHQLADMNELREGVRKSLPEIERIADPELREKVVEAWAFALSQTEFTSIDEIKPSGNPDTPPMTNGTQAQHLRMVARMAVAMADEIEAVVGPIGVDRDILWAGALCHDLGKPYEFSPRNQERWKSETARYGYPAIRHPVYGVYVALTAGLPERVAHCCGAHSGEGELLQRSLENSFIRFADHSFWRIMDRAGYLRPE